MSDDDLASLADLADTLRGLASDIEQAAEAAAVADDDEERADFMMTLELALNDAYRTVKKMRDVRYPVVKEED